MAICQTCVDHLEHILIYLSFLQDRQLLLQEHGLYWRLMVVPNILRLEHAVVSHPVSTSRHVDRHAG